MLHGTFCRERLSVPIQLNRQLDWIRTCVLSHGARSVRSIDNQIEEPRLDYDELIYMVKNEKTMLTQRSVTHQQRLNRSGRY